MMDSTPYGKKTICEKCISLAQKRYAFNEMAERLKESFGMTPVGAYEFFPPETLLGPIDADKRSAMQRQVEHYQERFSAPNKRSELCQQKARDEAEKIKCEAAKVAAKSGTCIGIMRSLSSAIDMFKAFQQTFKSLRLSAKKMTLKKVFHPCSGDFKNDGSCNHDAVMPNLDKTATNYCPTARGKNARDSAIFKIFMDKKSTCNPCPLSEQKMCSPNAHCCMVPGPGQNPQPKRSCACKVGFFGHGDTGFADGACTKA
jgi:hypothetical protein